MKRIILLALVPVMIALMLFSTFRLSGLPQRLTMSAAFLCVVGAVTEDWRSRRPRASRISPLVAIPSAVLTMILTLYPADPAQARIVSASYAVSMTLLIASNMLGKSSKPAQPR